jgi:hypothetical protein
LAGNYQWPLNAVKEFGDEVGLYDLGPGIFHGSSSQDAQGCLGGIGQKIQKEKGRALPISK